MSPGKTQAVILRLQQPNQQQVAAVVGASSSTQPGQASINGTSLTQPSNVNPSVVTTTLQLQTQQPIVVTPQVKPSPPIIDPAVEKQKKAKDVLKS